MEQMTARILIVALVLTSGCLNFGPMVTTTTPSAEHIAKCRAEMYVTPGLDIQPLGFRLDARGRDARIWFKFIAKTDDISKVFDNSKVDPQKIVSNINLDDDSLPSWWDVSAKSLLSGQVELPNARFMKVGYTTNTDGTLTVYIMWTET